MIFRVKKGLNNQIKQIFKIIILIIKVLIFAIIVIIIVTIVFFFILLLLDVFVLKIDADGVVGLDEIQEESMAFVYPNPIKGTVNIGGVEAEETVVYNTLGQRVMAFRGNEANVEVLADGVYMLRVTDGKGLTHTIRIVVNK